MNRTLIYAMVATTLVIVVFFLWWLLYRQYKRVGRRCPKKTCGRIDVKRVHKILLPRDESVSLKSPAGKWRWFIRRPVKLTFTVCKCGWVELVKIDTDPLSYWHARHTEKYHKEQYFYADPELLEAAQRKLRQWYLKGHHEDLNPQTSDTPPLSLESLFEGYLELVSDAIE